LAQHQDKSIYIELMTTDVTTHHSKEHYKLYEHFAVWSDIYAT